MSLLYRSPLIQTYLDIGGSIRRVGGRPGHYIKRVSVRGKAVTYWYRPPFAENAREHDAYETVSDTEIRSPVVNSDYSRLQGAWEMIPDVDAEIDLYDILNAPPRRQAS